MECKYCHSAMYLDDTDRDFHHKGDRDEYHNCPHCQSSVVLRYRNKHLAQAVWSEPYNEHISSPQEWYPSSLYKKGGGTID